MGVLRVAHLHVTRPVSVLPHCDGCAHVPALCTNPDAHVSRYTVTFIFFFLGAYVSRYKTRVSRYSPHLESIPQILTVTRKILVVPGHMPVLHLTCYTLQATCQPLHDTEHRPVVTVRKLPLERFRSFWSMCKKLIPEDHLFEWWIVSCRSSQVHPHPVRIPTLSVSPSCPYPYTVRIPTVSVSPLCPYPHLVRIFTLSVSSPCPYPHPDGVPAIRCALPVHEALLSEAFLLSPCMGLKRFKPMLQPDMSARDLKHFQVGKGPRIYSRLQGASHVFLLSPRTEGVSP